MLVGEYPSLPSTEIADPTQPKPQEIAQLGGHGKRYRSLAAHEAGQRDGRDARAPLNVRVAQAALNDRRLQVLDDLSLPLLLPHRNTSYLEKRRCQLVLTEYFCLFRKAFLSA